MAAAPKGVGGLGGWNLQTKRYLKAGGGITTWDQWGQTTWRSQETGKHLTTAELDALVESRALVELDRHGKPMPAKKMAPPKAEVPDAA